jgi:predicted porin
MKKTLIAAGIAAIVAAPAAFADVTVSGQVKVTMNNGGAKSDTTSNSAYTKMVSDNALTFKASEDLGNGLSAFAQITLDTDADTDTTATSASGATATTGTIQKDAKAGLKGSFGTVVYGRMETLTEGVASAKMDDGVSSHTADSDNLESAITYVGRENAVAYVSPTFNGFHFAVAGVNISTNSDTFSDRELLLAYDNGPLSVVGTYADLVAGGAADANAEVMTLTGSYKIGDAKITAQWVDRDVDASQANQATNTTLADATDTMIRLDYTMGNNVLLLGHKNAEASTGDVTIVKLTHKLSKKTAVYAGTRMVDATGEENDVFVGALHKF